MSLRNRLNRINRGCQETVCRHLRIFCRASITLESAFVLPLFLMACVTLASFMDALRIQTEKSLTLSNRVRQLAACAGLAGAEGEGIWIDISNPEKYTYPFSVFGVPALRMAVRARVFPWIGSEEGIGGSEEDEEGAAGEKTVYITDNQSVYHTDPDCTHIDLAIYKSTTSEVGNLRNAYGRRYKKCSGFPKNYSGEVYVTEKGDYYYPSADYAGLTRHVHIVSESDVSGLKECSRCALHSAA